MQKEAQVTAFEGGQLRFLASGEKGREAVLALPLNRLLVKLVRVPAESDPAEFALPLLQAASPFPDDALTVSCETVSEDADGKVVLAAALPESAADDIGEALDAAKLNVVRIDSLALGQLRGIWSSLGEGRGRRLVLMKSPDCISLVVLDGDLPTAIRALTDETDIRREVMLSLLEAEDFGGAKKLEEIVVVEGEDKSDERGERDKSGEGSGETLGEQEVSCPSRHSCLSCQELASLAPLRRLTVGADAALVGVMERSADPAALNALPASWREVLEEARFKAKLFRYLAVACGLWVLAMGVLFGVPVAYGFMTDHQKGLSKQHARQYKAVKEMKAKVDLIHKYSDHARGALEIMKAVSDRLPEGVTLSSWTYRRDEGVRVSGDAETSESTYAFKDAMDAMTAGEDEDGEKIFNTVNLNGPNASKGGYRFDLDCGYQGEEEE